MSFVGGKLTLKGGEPLKTAGGVKKKKKKKASTGEAGDNEETPAETKKVSKLGGYELSPPSKDEDRRTEAQRRHDERMAKLEEERLRKVAAKGYRDRVKEFNEHLASLSEHHDIPKVGPG